MKGIGYIRVSRVGGRDGKRQLPSPQLQRKSIESVCHREGVELIDVDEELDRSGGDAAWPLWNRAIERIEAGEAQAFVCWNLSRFAGSTLDAKRCRDVLLVVAERSSVDCHEAALPRGQR